MQYGPIEELLEKRRAKGQSADPLDEKPELAPELLPYWFAFLHLSGARTISEAGPQPIALSEVWAYCQLAEVHDLDERDDLLRFIREMDSVYLEEMSRARSARRNPS